MPSRFPRTHIGTHDNTASSRATAAWTTNHSRPSRTTTPSTTPSCSYEPPQTAWMYVPVVRGILRAVMVMKYHAFTFGLPGTRLVPSHRRSTTRASFQVGRRFLSTTMTETKQQPAGICAKRKSCGNPAKNSLRLIQLIGRKYKKFSTQRRANSSLPHSTHSHSLTLTSSHSPHSPHQFTHSLNHSSSVSHAST